MPVDDESSLLKTIFNKLRQFNLLLRFEKYLIMKDNFRLLKSQKRRQMAKLARYS